MSTRHSRWRTGRLANHAFDPRLSSWPRWRSFVARAGPFTLPLLFTSTVPTNSGQDADQDVPDDAADDATESDQSETAESDASALQRSQDAIDDGWDAAQEALKDTLPDAKMDEETRSGQGQQDTGR
jgi:hypothetical protein